MPPKTQFTAGELTEKAIDLVRASGIDALSARTLAAAVGCSVKPIFAIFGSMDGVNAAVIQQADSIYQGYIQSAIQDSTVPPYKAGGMGYIRFASEEKELFKLLFMRDRHGETPAENRESIRPLLTLIQQQVGIDEDTAYRFHLEMWIYVHGIATMMATAYLPWDMAFVSETLTDVYQGLKKRFGEEKHIRRYNRTAHKSVSRHRRG